MLCKDVYYFYSLVTGRQRIQILLNDLRQKKNQTPAFSVGEIEPQPLDHIECRPTIFSVANEKFSNQCQQSVSHDHELNEFAFGYHYDFIRRANIHIHIQYSYENTQTHLNSTNQCIKTKLHLYTKRNLVLVFNILCMLGNIN